MLFLIILIMSNSEQEPLSPFGETGCPALTATKLAM